MSFSALGDEGSGVDESEGGSLLQYKTVNKSTSQNNTASCDDDSDWRASVVKGLHAAGFNDDAEAFERCGGEVLELACFGCGHPKEVPMSCNLRICPDCAKRFATRIAQQILDVWHSLPIKQFWLLKKITLTVKTDGKLREAYDKGWTAIPKLWRKYLQKYDDSGEVISGMVVSAEFGPKSGNVHFHILYFGPYLPQADLSRWWEELTGSFVVDIRRAIQPGETALDAIQECLKYPSKFFELSPELLVDVHATMKGSRRIRTYGAFYGRVRPRPPVPCPECGNTTWVITGHRTAWGVWSFSDRMAMLGHGAGGKAR